MKCRNHNQDAFLALVKAGLWEKDVRFAQFGEVDFNEVLRLAEEQSVVGLIAAGLEHVTDVKVPKEIVLQFVGRALQLEQQNTAMNSFVAMLVEKLRNADIYTLLVKGQGIAQCYERPLWRACGDVDLLLSNDNYEKAKALLLPLASYSDIEEKYGRHIGLTIEPWNVELHGTQRCELSHRMDKVLDEIQNDLFFGGNVRPWQNGRTTVFLPSSNNDIIIIFTHIIKHYFKEGVGLRQICDWCRLLWTYREKIDVPLLDKRLRKMGLKTEWKAFAALAVDYLGMPAETIPFYSAEKRWQRKAYSICEYIMQVGNFGHNRNVTYFEKYPYIVRKSISFWRRTGYLFRHASVFPWDSLRFFPSLVFNGVRSALRGE